jgi:hypothetical protein
MQQHNNEHFPVELSSQLVSIITTEHYNLQTGRSITTAESNGRSSLFVGAVSSGLIALTFVGQIAHLGTAFFVFSLVVIPTLVFMGLITFERVLQSDLQIICTLGVSTEFATSIWSMPHSCNPTLSFLLMMIEEKH